MLVVSKLVDVYYKGLQIKNDCRFKEVRKTSTLVFRFMTYGENKQNFRLMHKLTTRWPTASKTLFCLNFKLVNGH